MFKRAFKTIALVLGGLVVLAIVLIGVLYAVGSARLTRKYDVQSQTIALPSDATSVEQGRHWAVAYCSDCHGEDFSGKPLVDDSTIGFIPAPNLTAGEGGAGSEFTDADWVRALRQGVDPEGRVLIGMPSMNYYYMSDKDLGALIAYLKTVPPVDHDLGEPAMSFAGKVLLAAGAFGGDILPAEVIDHGGARPSAAEPAVNAEYGAYLVRLGGCRDCHGRDLRGGHSPAPGSPQAPDLTPAGIFGPWSKETFITAARTMQGSGMPWAALRPLTDAELQAIYAYLHSLPSK